MPVRAHLQHVLQDNTEILSYSWTNLLLPGCRGLTAASS